MSDKLWSKIESVLIMFTLSLVVVMITAFLVYVPATMYAKAECLTAGYPIANVSIGLEMYCVNSGDVIQLSKLKEG